MTPAQPDGLVPAARPDSMPGRQACDPHRWLDGDVDGTVHAEHRRHHPRRHAFPNWVSPLGTRSDVGIRTDAKAGCPSDDRCSTGQSRVTNDRRTARPESEVFEMGLIGLLIGIIVLIVILQLLF